MAVVRKDSAMKMAIACASAFAIMSNASPKLTLCSRYEKTAAVTIRLISRVAMRPARPEAPDLGRFGFGVVFNNPPMLGFFVDPLRRYAQIPNQANPRERLQDVVRDIDFPPI